MTLPRCASAPSTRQDPLPLAVSDDLPEDGWIAREWEVEGRTVHGRMAKAN